MWRESYKIKTLVNVDSKMMRIAECKVSGIVIFIKDILHA